MTGLKQASHSSITGQHKTAPQHAIGISISEQERRSAVSLHYH